MIRTAPSSMWLGITLLVLPACAAFADLKPVVGVGCVAGHLPKVQSGMVLGGEELETFTNPEMDLEFMVWEWEYHKGELDAASLTECESDCETPPPKGADICRVDLETPGTTKVLWKSTTDPHDCETRVKALVEALEATGFECLWAG